MHSFFIDDEGKKRYEAWEEESLEEPRVLEWARIGLLIQSLTDEELKYLDYKKNLMREVTKQSLIKYWQTEGSEAFHKEYLKCLDTGFGIYLQ